MKTKSLVIASVLLCVCETAAATVVMSHPDFTGKTLRVAPTAQLFSPLAAADIDSAATVDVGGTDELADSGWPGGSNVTAAVPEPPVWALIAVGLLGLSRLRRL